MPIFGSFHALIPQEKYMNSWAVIACDQFTSQPEYWRQVRAIAENVPSAVHCILPEAELASSNEDTYAKINATMQEYLDGDVFRCYPDSFVYVERILQDGSVRAGIVGAIDLETYDFHSDATSAIRATEKTVEERLPPRMQVRRNAPFEMTHVLLLSDDADNSIAGGLDVSKLTKVYDFDLMQGGGHITGWLIDGEEARKLEARLEAYCQKKAQEFNGVDPVLFLVGDGNHSLATAKQCYEELKRKTQDETVLARARYAMVELENIRDDSQKFEPIHRVMTGVDADHLLAFLQNTCCAQAGHPIQWTAGIRRGTLYLDEKLGTLPIGILQTALDQYMAQYPGEIDYIHGDDTVVELSQAANSVGFLLQAIPKDSFFKGIANDGVLPRKTFSMGHAQEKRYYLEARIIK